jgi:Fe-S-cluster containining protein
MQYENVIFPHSVGFRCKNCGVCCRNQPPDINFNEEEKIRDKGFENFLEDPIDSNNRNISKKEDGSCFFLTKDNVCRIQDVKPGICVLDPFVIADFDPKTNRIFLGLNPLAAVNCRGVFVGELTNVEEIGKVAQTIVREIMEEIAKKTGLSIKDKKVASLTRELILDGS